MMHQPALPDPQKGKKLKKLVKNGLKCYFSREIANESAQFSAYIVSVDLHWLPLTNIG
jgi:hypothetical protein